jgi:hypothetical protein
MFAAGDEGDTLATWPLYPAIFLKLCYFFNICLLLTMTLVKENSEWRLTVRASQV